MFLKINKSCAKDLGLLRNHVFYNSVGRIQTKIYLYEAISKKWV